MQHKNIKRKFLAAKIAAVFVLSTGGMGTITDEAQAGIPVIDVAGLTQSIISAIQNVQQVLQQVKDYQNQLQQLQNQVINTIQPAVFLWDDANNIINGLLNKIDTVSNLANQFGSIDNYLDRFQDINTYRNAPCLDNGCNRAQMTAWLRGQRDLSADKSGEVQETNRAIIRGVEDQQIQLQADAQSLRDLQNNAVGVQGNLEAIQTANQLASAQANQLLQIRGLLISQQSAVASSQLLDADKTALEAAATEKVRDVDNIVPSPVVVW